MSVDDIEFPTWMDMLWAEAEEEVETKDINPLKTMLPCENPISSNEGAVAYQSYDGFLTVASFW